MLLNGPVLIAVGVFELSPFLRPGTGVVARMMHGLLGAYMMTLGPVSNSGWWASMRTASCLVSKTLLFHFRLRNATGSDHQREQVFVLHRE